MNTAIMISTTTAKPISVSAPPDNFLAIDQFIILHNAPQHARLWNGGEAAMEKTSPCLRWLCAVSDVREPLGMLYNFFRQVDIKVRPIEVAWRLFLNVHNCADRLLLKPGKTVVGHKKLSVVRQKPHAMRRNVRHLNCRSAVSKR